MSRPKPKVLLEIVNKASFKRAIFYDNKPINLKIINMVSNFPGPKYKKVSFSNQGHAINLCKKLNEQFKTDKFSVVLLSEGEKIFP